MQIDEVYVDRLEQMIINQLLPIYKRYYKMQGVEAPALDVEIVKKLDRQEPALFKAWPLNS